MPDDKDKSLDASAKYIEVQRTCLKRQAAVQRQSKTLERNLALNVAHYDLVQGQTERRMFQEQKRIVDLCLAIPSGYKEEAKRRIEQHSRYYKSCHMKQTSARRFNDLPPVQTTFNRFLTIKSLTAPKPKAKRKLSLVRPSYAEWKRLHPPEPENKKKKKKFP